MGEITVNYDDLGEPEVVEKLKAKEDAIQSAMAKLGHAAVRWGWFDNGQLRLPRLFSGEECIAQFRIGDFDLDSGELEQLIVDDKRPCINIPKQQVYNNSATIEISGEKCEVAWGPSGKSYKAWGRFRGEYFEGKGKSIRKALDEWEHKARRRSRE